MPNPHADPQTLALAMIHVRETATDDQHAARALAHLQAQVPAIKHAPEEQNNAAPRRTAPKTALKLEPKAEDTDAAGPEEPEPRLQQSQPGPREPGDTTGGQPEGTGEAMAPSPQGPGTPAADQGGGSHGQSHDPQAAGDVPGRRGVATTSSLLARAGGVSEESQTPPAKDSPSDSHKEGINRGFDRYKKILHANKHHQEANWVGQLQAYVNKVGGEEALKSMPEERPARSRDEKVAYGLGADPKELDNDFKAYLDRWGIVPVALGGSAPPNLRLMSSIAPSKGGIPERGREGDIPFPKESSFNKLEEAQHLPGLETTEDLSKLVGEKVKKITPRIIAILDATYGKDAWILKPYFNKKVDDKDTSYGGKHVFYADRVHHMPVDARMFFTTDQYKQAMRNRNLQIIEDKEGNYIGVKDKNSPSGRYYRFDTPEYGKLLDHLKENSDSPLMPLFMEKLEAAAINRNGFTLPRGSFMVQPVFPAAIDPTRRGRESEEAIKRGRAAGYTYEGSGEGRVHVVTRNGEAEAVPYATHIKGRSFPVIFQNEHSRAMERAALDAIYALPKSERQGQIYGPDVMPTRDGYRVIEANPSDKTGSSGYLDDYPQAIEALVAHLLGQEPQFVTSLRRLLRKQRAEKKLRQQVSKTIRLRPIEKASPLAAGLAVVADDTGRLLLLQRQLDASDPNSGRWEFPGGKHEGGAPKATALREWKEEVGLDLPEGRHDSSWISNDGKYHGFVYRVPKESDVPIHEERRPDGDPDSGGWAAVAWVDPRDLPHHNLRPALLNDVDNVLARVVKHLTAMRVVEKGRNKS